MQNTEIYVLMTETECELCVLTEGTARKLTSTAIITVDCRDLTKIGTNSKNRGTHIQSNARPFAAQFVVKVLPAWRIDTAVNPHSSELAHV
jgi:hypothetical protein